MKKGAFPCFFICSDIFLRSFLLSMSMADSHVSSNTEHLVGKKRPAFSPHEDQDPDQHCKKRQCFGENSMGGGGGGQLPVGEEEEEEEEEEYIPLWTDSDMEGEKGEGEECIRLGIDTETEEDDYIPLEAADHSQREEEEEEEEEEEYIPLEYDSEDDE
ncbi:hypothetical protein Dimus_018983 [Dionaea muscipula]